METKVVKLYTKILNYAWLSVLPLRPARVLNAFMQW